MISPTVLATIVLSALVGIALIGASVLFKLLKSTASIQQKGVQLGGAAAGFFVLFALLNNYLPGIASGIREDSVAQPILIETAKGGEQTVEVTLSPSTQFISRNELKRLDRNKYDIYEGFGLALPRVHGDKWEVGKLTEFQPVGFWDIPVMQVTLEKLRELFGANRPTVFGIQERNVRSLTLLKTSTVGGVSLTNSLLADRIVLNMLRGELAARRKISIADVAETDDLLRQRVEFHEYKNALQTVIERRLPVKKKLRNGVFVIPLSKEELDSGSYLATYGAVTLLDKARSYLTTSGYFPSGSIGNLYIDQGRRIASFNHNTHLTNVEVDGKMIDILLNYVGFVVTSDDRAVIVLLVYSSTDGDIQPLEELKTFFNRLRFSA